MRAYKYQTFCVDAGLCNTYPCRRRITGEDTERAARLGVPISWASFADSCPIYTPVQREDDDTHTMRTLDTHN